MTSKTPSLLVIPDSHATPGHSNRRYTWLGKLIRDLEPDCVVDIGDWVDLPSLSSYDQGAKKAYEGRQYKKDIDAGIHAQDLMFRELKGMRKRPRFVRCLGNHEDRITRAIDADPILRNTIGLKDLQSKEYGWEEYPFLKPVSIYDIRFSHYFVTGISGRPISGENPAKMMLQKQFKSATAGHSHVFDYAIRTNADGRRLHGCVVGCYTEEHLSWADPMAHLWWRGVVLKRNVDRGQYDLTQIGLGAIKREYSK